MNVNSSGGGSKNHTTSSIGNHHTFNNSILTSNANNQQYANSNGQQPTLRISRSSTRKKPFHFISNMWKMKKIIKFEDIMFHREMNCRARSEPSVSTYNCTSKGCQRKSSPSFSMLSLSPGKFQKSDELEVTRLRLSRNDNPFVQKVLASRDNVTDVIDDTESDDAILILMSDEFNGETETDPLALPQVHEHMIRSPPPTFWPRSQKTVFNFGGDDQTQIGTDSIPGGSKHQRANQCNY
ncbi:uncharacterized protein LOC128307116 [Anopheles moucheti]|uniref:uncharacterized protein LOC128307116 n=1 Tax=Anopheles moucheti TaxID=186751 RepID=UPI0022F0A041|nr:uncharacterized protein LOC128307116 [Anopheles moucheti]